MNISHFENAIILIGPQHVGKSTIGTLLAKALSENISGYSSKKSAVPFLDCDQLILDYISQHESQDFDTIRAVYRALGKDTFQKIETIVLGTLPSPPYVCATSGGLASNAPAYAQLSASTFKKTLLSASPDTIWPRIIENGVPAYLYSCLPASLQGKSREQLSEAEILIVQKEFTALFQERMEIYKSIADLIIDTDSKTPAEITETIVRYVVG